MEYLTLNNGARMPLVGFGTFMPGGEACTNAVKEAQNQELLDFTARRLYEMAADCVMSQLIIQDATKAPELFAQSAQVYGTYAESEEEMHFNFIRKFKAEELESYRK